MCMARPKLNCPNCKQRLIATRPDSSHPYWSYDKPQETDVNGEILEQVYECKNPDCKKTFTVYWYDEPMFIDRA